jgi:uncharacterized protein with gpF-like domain
MNDVMCKMTKFVTAEFLKKPLKIMQRGWSKMDIFIFGKFWQHFKNTKIMQPNFKKIGQKTCSTEMHNVKKYFRDIFYEKCEIVTVEFLKKIRKFMQCVWSKMDIFIFKTDL